MAHPHRPRWGWDSLLPSSPKGSPSSSPGHTPSTLAGRWRYPKAARRLSTSPWQPGWERCGFRSPKRVESGAPGVSGQPDGWEGRPGPPGAGGGSSLELPRGAHADAPPWGSLMRPPTGTVPERP